MSINHPFSRLKIKRRGGTPAPTPEPTVQIEFNPNHILLMADSVIESPSQRTTLQNDVIAIHVNTAGARRPDIAANISWVDTEGALGVYDFTIVDNLVAMCQAINVGCYGAGQENRPNGAKAYLKFFLRNYSSNVDGSSKPSVPVYMQSVSGSAYNTDSTGAYPGAGVNSNGEYQGFLGAGVGVGNLTRQAKIWVPDVAIRFREWMKAFGAYCNDLPQIGGFIINETSVLSAANKAATATEPAVFYGTSLSSPGSPTANKDIIAQYFQNYWQAIIDARPSWSKKEFFVSAGHPVTTLYTDQPLNPGVMFTNYAIGEYVQDGYEIYSYTPKDAVQRIAKNVQPYAAETNSYMSFISGDVRRHKGVDGKLYYSTSSVNVGTGIPGNKTILIQNSSTNTGKPAASNIPDNASIVLVANRNDTNQATVTGTVVPGSYDVSTGSVQIAVTSKTGTGTHTAWEVGIAAPGAVNWLPPSTLDEMVRGACTPRASFPWSAHKFDGATHIAYQVNTTVKTRTNENSINYTDYLAYIEGTNVQLQTARPANLDNHVW